MRDLDGRTTTERVLSIGAGFAYLSLLSLIVCRVAEIHFVLAALIVFGLASIVTVSIGLFCVKLVNRSKRGDRFGLSTILLIFVPASVYLSVTHWIVQLLRPPDPAAGSPWPAALFLSVVFFVLTTALLLMMGEAIAWIIVRRLRGRKD